MKSELVKPAHLARKAVVYIRQSTPHQVVSNLESLRLQYGLRQRAHEPGWHEADIDVIDADLGLERSIRHPTQWLQPTRRAGRPQRGRTDPVDRRERAWHATVRIGYSPPGHLWPMWLPLSPIATASMIRAAPTAACFSV